MTGLGGGAASLNRHSGELPPLYQENLLNSGGAGLIFGPYDSSGNALVGYLGPVKADLRTYYKNTKSWGNWVDDDDYFTTTTTGIQVWHAPVTAKYTFEMTTPQFHVSNNGKGRHLKFDYDLIQGQRVFILPGHRCHPTPDGNSSHGGNGGTFVVLGDSSESNLTTDLYNRTKSDVLAVCGGAGKSTLRGNATIPGQHPSGGDDETSQNNGSGRGPANYHINSGGGPSGGAGFLKGACQHHENGVTTFVYTDKQDSTGFIYDADAFVRGGLGGRGYVSNSASSQNNNGMNGSGGFGGGGGQSTGNSYSSGAGGYQGGNENDGTTFYPDTYFYSNGERRHCGGGSYVKSGIFLRTNQEGTGSNSYVKINYAPSGELGSQANPADSAAHLYSTGNRTNGVYYINGGSGTAREFYCILDAQWGGGGGWMVIANHDAQKYPKSGHQARPTSHSSHVGGDNGVSASGLKPEYSFSCDMTGVPYTKVMHFCYNNSDMTNISSSNWLGNPLVYWCSSFNEPKTIPSNAAWAQLFDNTGLLLSWGGSNVNKRHSYSQWNYDCEGWGVMNNQSQAVPNVNGSGSHSSQDYPLYIGTWLPNNFTNAMETMSWCDTSTYGYDDWQDGSGQSDQWYVEGVSSPTGGNARNKPSMLLVQ